MQRGFDRPTVAIVQARFVAQQLDQPPARDRRQPASQRGLVPVAVEPPERAQEDVLNQVIDERPVGHVEGEQNADTRLMAAHELGERDAVACAGQLHQLGFFLIGEGARPLHRFLDATTAAASLGSVMGHCVGPAAQMPRVVKLQVGEDPVLRDAGASERVVTHPRDCQRPLVHTTAASNSAQPSGVSRAAVSSNRKRAVLRAGAGRPSSIGIPLS